MRQRLTWGKEASMEKKADPYMMNTEKTNPPVEKYKTGDPSSWAEDPDMRKPWEGEGRNEVGLAAPKSEAPAAPAAPAAPEAPEAPAEVSEEKEEMTEAKAQEAIASMQKLQGKALKCITIAQRMLPGASDELIEAQAKEFMYMPERCVLATLQRQIQLGEILANEEEEEKEEEEKKEEKPVVKAEEEEKKEEKPVKVEEEEKKEEVEAKKEEQPKEETTPEEKVEASDLLDVLFADDEQVKTGAKKLSGLVKQASSGNGSLDNLWELPPDISSALK